MAKVTAHQEDEAWTALSRWLPPRNVDCDYWWQLTGRHLAKLLQAAGYSDARQHDALVFHYHWIVKCSLAKLSCIRLWPNKMYRFLIWDRHRLPPSRGDRF
jgi:hypothetical protein